LFQALIAIFNK